jgi:hypothetical protein
MEVVALVLALAGVGVAGAGLLVLVRVRRELDGLADRADALAEQVGALPPELARTFGTGARHLISVEILNLFELAHRESALTRPLTVVAPRLVRDTVHRILVSRVRQNLRESGVEADVRLHRAR